MPLLDSDFNNFATTLTRRFSDRSKGLDPDSRRIIAARPSDRILAGFLTPVRSDQSFALSFTSEMEDADGESAEGVLDSGAASHGVSLAGLRWWPTLGVAVLIND